MKNIIIAGLLSVILVTDVSAQKPGLKGLKLWYNDAARGFEEALPLGNGRLGVMVYGGVQKERLSLNEESLWSGGPVDAHMNPNAKNYLQPVREALFDENYKKADSLMHFMQGKYSASYAPLGNLMFDFKYPSGQVTGYKRELDIQRAMSKVSYQIGQTTYTRETFVSYPDQVVVMRLSAKGKDKLNFSCKLTSLLLNRSAVEQQSLTMNGYAPIYAAPNYLGNVPNPIVQDTLNAMRFNARLKILKLNGKSEFRGARLMISDASEVVILLSMATSYNGFDKNPGKEGKSEQQIALGHLQKIGAKGYDALQARHVSDFRKYFDRVDLNLGPAAVKDLSTKERLINFSKGAEDQDLIALYYQYSRYLLISSSRPGGIPANLQGIWNEEIRPPWSSNFTTNINAEMNYWGAEAGNLSEMHTPLFDFIGRLAKTGAITAKDFYNCAGWVCNHNTDIWAQTNPVGDFGKGDVSWANWPMGGAWLSTHLWEHYAFTGDKNFLRAKAYPLMKGATAFCLDFLVKDKKGNLITAPSTSPENYFRIPGTGYEGAAAYGGTADLAMIRELFVTYLKAAELLNLDAEMQKKVKEALDKLYPYQIGKAGNLQEWYYDWEDTDPRHRHLSHLFAVYPGYSITSSGSPKLADAVRRSLDIRTNEGTGWAITWRINLWARLQNGERSYDAIKKLLRYKGEGTPLSMGGGGTYANLFCAHPPFQIDGNFGGGAGISEMILQSHQGYIELLPAIPEQWKEGEVKGLCARGGFVVGIKWKNGKLVSATLSSKYGGTVKLKYGLKLITLKTLAGKQYTWNGIS
ncbi:alpha-L-fucosidase 2 [Pedobacter steynii]|uniref:Alpha-L-fucosidase 2 n=1 Tax=Pedobacter steynii TaxID=430522 RepID=A0A1G9W8S4_9SPHI|nr:glycoside hydrolase family 95 protein [Pedobacter steynii]NQX40217.1 glycoside hydrolase family 95 protein [Pedobacter steynii]SDM80974.1 alpha-L-fucosidase 2 [Pedobacter steynii]